MKILMMCKHNRFRSKVAESIFKKLDKNNNQVKSAGIQIDILRPYICENVKSIMKEKSYEINDEQARAINTQDLAWADLIVIVANNIDKNIFKGKTKARIIVWKIGDADENDYPKIKKLIAQIEKKVIDYIDS
jgi:protein-tyrosine-phosphatase